MNKKLLFRAFALVAALSSVVSAQAYDFGASGLYLNITGTNTVEVTYNENNASYTSYTGNVTIPPTVTYGGTQYNVTKIGNNAFRNCGDLTGVTIPSSITEIGYFAFYQCTKLTSVDIPNSVTRIWHDAFGKTGLEYVYVPNSVTYMGSEAFYNCTNLRRADLSGTITTIDMRTFQGCTSLTFIDIPNGIKTIGASAFKDCTKLYDVTLPFSMRTINQQAFSGCTTLNKLTCYAQTPPSLYDDNVFSTANYNSTILEVPNSVLSAYQSADGWKRFNNTSVLPYDFIVDYLEYVITSSTTAKCVGCVLPSPEGYWGIPDAALGYDVTAIEEDAFYGCNEITGLRIGSKVESIGGAAFALCTGLTEMNIPDAVTYVGGLSFYGCSSLSKVVIGKNCKFFNSSSWSSNVFTGCTSLTKIYCLSEQPMPFHEPMFDETTYNNAVLWVPGGCEEAYRNCDYWYKFSNIQGIYGLDETLNVPGGNLHFASTGQYPWYVEMNDQGELYARSGNAGAHSSSSVLSTYVYVEEDTRVRFMFKARGEEGSRIYDECRFEIDGNEVFTFGTLDDDWYTNTSSLTAGPHTLTWSYIKDSSVHPAGDYFAVRNVELLPPAAILGDVDCNGSVGISDVTSIIDYILTGNSSGLNLTVGDVDHDGIVGIADATTIIDYILTSSW